jgi:hypothetical protein
MLKSMILWTMHAANWDAKKALAGAVLGQT